MEKSKVKGKRRRKISGKIMFSILLVNLISLLVIAGIVVFLMDQNVGSEAKKMAENQVEVKVNEFEQDFSDIESAVSIIVNEVKAEVDVARAKRDKQYLQDYKKELVTRLKSVGENTDLTRSIYLYFNTVYFDQEVDIWMLGKDDGTFELQDSFGYDYYLDYNEWYTEPIENKRTLWTFPYESAAGGIITSYVTPVVVDGTAIALVGMDLYLDDVQETLEATTLFDTGYLYMMHPDGRVLIHPRVDFESNLNDEGDYDGLLEKMASEETGFTTYERDDGQKVVAAFSHLNNGWIIASSIPEKEVLKVVSMVITVMIIITVISLVVAVVVSVVMGKSITKPITQIVEVVEKIKDGDFTNIVEVESNDETLVLAEGINEMSLAVKGLISEAKHVASNLVDSAGNLAAMAEETNATVDQVAVTIGEITRGTQETATDAEKGAGIAGDIRHQFVILMDNSSAMRGNAEVAMTQNRTGLKALDSLREKSTEANDANAKVKDAVYNLDQKANAITDIIQTITSIAEQTNLLALNASIEAARAGEAGRGFAVVAEEIRKLAESSSEAAEEIKTIIVDIQHESKDTRNVMDEVSVMNEQQNIALVEVDEAFNKIFSSVEGISKQIETVTHELDELDVSKNSLIEAVTNISAISEETAAATEQVEHSMDEQTKAVEQVASNAERLNELSAELNEKIQVFKIEK
jgi:methyl-accepting chemotaxis protein